MKNYIDSLFNPTNRKLTFILLGSGVLMILLAMLIGVSDNPPGIAVLFTGMILTFLAFVHYWRSAKAYLWLMLFSLLGGVVFAVLHNLLDALSVSLADISFLPNVIEVFSAMCFLIAVLVCPVGLVVGFLGALLTYFLNMNPKKAAE